jgi:uncharacterized protein YjbJ (UPF0337 family)
MTCEVSRTARRGTLSSTTTEEYTVPNSDEVKGRVKEAAGDLTDNKKLQREGKSDQAAGKVKGAVDDAKDKIEDAVDAVKDRLHRD